MRDFSINFGGIHYRRFLLQLFWCFELCCLPPAASSASTAAPKHIIKSVREALTVSCSQPKALKTEKFIRHFLMFFKKEISSFWQKKTLKGRHLKIHKCSAVFNFYAITNDDAKKWQDQKTWQKNFNQREVPVTKALLITFMEITKVQNYVFKEECHKLKDLW